jgi:GT2 family glycosyltransferase
MKISVVIPVYKNKELFLSMLESNYPIIEKYEIIVVDDASGENIGEEIATLYPKVTVLINEHNLGFSGSVNRGIFAAKGELILLLNSDVKLIDNSFAKNLDIFNEDKTLFGVSFLQIERDGRRVGKNSIYFERGLFLHKKSLNLEKGLNGWAECGSCLLRKSYFEKMNGLDMLFSPFYWEDIDLSYRAYKLGYHVLFDPACIVEHHHESTIGKYFMKDKVKVIAYRNHFIFMWKNLSDIHLLFMHLLFLGYNLLYLSAKGEYGFVKGFFQALIFMPKIIKKRSELKKLEKVNDKNILDLFLP